MSINSNNVSAATPGEAVGFAQVVLVAIPWRKRHELPPSDRFKGKIVIDAMNPYSENYEVIDLGNSTSSEEVRTTLPLVLLKHSIRCITRCYVQAIVTPRMSVWSCCGR